MPTRPMDIVLLVAFLSAVPAVPAVPAAAPGGLSAGERSIARAVEKRVPAALALLERSVNVNSGTLNPDGVREVGRMFAPHFEALGFRTRWVDGAPFGRAGHLVGERSAPAADAPRVLLIGHLDTVFERDSPFQRWERLDDSTARGPGTTDMKGGIVVALLALQALAEAGELDRCAFSLYLGGDEEKSGRPLAEARRDLVAAAEWADVAIGFEDGDGDPRTAVISRRGSLGWTLRTAGRPSHSSQIFKPEVGSGAIFEAARIVNAFHDSLAGEPLLTLNPGLVLGGSRIALEGEGSRGTAAGKTNVVAESTVVAGDLRTLTPAQLERAMRVMRGIVAGHRPMTSAEIAFDDGYPPLAPSDGNRRLLALYDRASRDLGHGPVTPVDPSLAGAADVSFCEGRVGMAIDGVGLMGSGGHTVNETADLRTLPSQAQRIAVTLSRLARSWRSLRTAAGAAR